MFRKRRPPGGWFGLEGSLFLLELDPTARFSEIYVDFTPLRAYMAKAKAKPVGWSAELPCFHRCASEIEFLVVLGDDLGILAHDHGPFLLGGNDVHRVPTQRNGAAT